MVRAIRLSIEAIDRRLEDAAGTLGANAAWTFALVTLPLALPGVMVGRDPVLRQGARRVRRDHHVRVQHPGRDPDHLGRDLHLHPGSGRRRQCVAADRGRDRDRARGPRRLGDRRSARRAAGWRNSNDPLRRRDHARRLQPRRRLRERRRRRRPVRPLGLRQVGDDRADRRAAASRPRHHRGRRPRAGRHRGEHLRAQTCAAGSASSIRTPGCFPISRCGRT